MPKRLSVSLSVAIFKKCEVKIGTHGDKHGVWNHTAASEAQLKLSGARWQNEDEAPRRASPRGWGTSVTLRPQLLASDSRSSGRQGFGVALSAVRVFNT